ncbi:MAG: TrkH family potassium uptake protein [Euryarchaeota archaeon]|nr:TrkH family potassium uptake protein [Euryarchaeota archaeon]
MQIRAVTGNLGAVLVFFSFAFLLPIVPAYAFEEPGSRPFGTYVPDNALVFFSVFLLTLILGLILKVRGGNGDLRRYEGFAVVSLSYLLVSIVGAIPYLLTGTIASPLDAFFESMSGFATVGATVIPYPVEAHPASVLFWRSLTQWLGGMGIIVLAMALLAGLVSTGSAMMQAEYSGGAPRLKERLASTARTLWGAYLALTIILAGLLFVLFRAGGLPERRAAYEALVVSFSTLSTGGFSVWTDSVAKYGSWPVELAVMAFMILGAVSFRVHRDALSGRAKAYSRDQETRLFVSILVIVTIALTLNLLLSGSEEAWASTGGRPDVLVALRQAAFTVVSISTTTGFTTANFDLWPDFSKQALLMLMIIGGCAGSTAGGVKVMRFIVLAKLFRREILRIIHPRSPPKIRIGRDVLSEDAVRNISAFFFAYLIIFVVSAVILAGTGLPMLSSASSVAQAMGGVGIAMGPVVGGPGFTFAAIDPVAKVVLIADMWLGRLEIFAVLLLFARSAYRE